MGEPLNIPIKGFRKGEKEMAEGCDRGMLMVGVSGHNREAVRLSPLQEFIDQGEQPIRIIHHLVPQKETHIQDDLVIPASSRMDLSPVFDSQPADEKALRIGMNVLLGRIQLEPSLLMEPLHLPQTPENLPPVRVRKNRLAAEHEDVGPAAPEIVRHQHLVTWRNCPYVSSGQEIHHRFRRHFLKPSSPEFLDLHRALPQDTNPFTREITPQAASISRLPERDKDGGSFLPEFPKC
jgi:hypothetical protein